MTGTLDPRGGWTADRCSMAKALEVVSARSSFFIMREAFYGTTRFDDFAQRVGITDAVAAARLRELVADGLLAREPYREPGQRTRHEYRLTEKGADLFPVLVALLQWGDRWLNDGGRIEGCATATAARAWAPRSAVPRATRSRPAISTWLRGCARGAPRADAWSPGGSPQRVVPGGG